MQLYNSAGANFSRFIYFFLTEMLTKNISGRVENIYQHPEK